jgi:hypothetical protein
LRKPKQASKGWRKIHRPEAKKATGQATKMRRRIQRRAKQGLPAILTKSLEGGNFGTGGLVFGGGGVNDEPEGGIVKSEDARGRFW